MSHRRERGLIFAKISLWLFQKFVLLDITLFMYSDLYWIDNAKSPDGETDKVRKSTSKLKLRRLLMWLLVDGSRSPNETSSLWSPSHKHDCADPWCLKSQRSTKSPLVSTKRVELFKCQCLQWLLFPGFRCLPMKTIVTYCCKKRIFQRKRNPWF